MKISYILPFNSSTISKPDSTTSNLNTSKLCLNIVRIEVVLFLILAKKLQHKLFTVNLKNLD